MEDIVAVEVLLDDGSSRYFLTWGRIQSNVDPTPLESIVFEHASAFALSGAAVRAMVLPNLSAAVAGPYFFEGFFEMCQRVIPTDEGYEAWRREMDARMHAGKEMYFLGTPPDNQETDQSGASLEQ